MEVLGELQITDSTKIVLSKGEFRNNPRIDFRTYFKKDGEYIATKKGINFHEEWTDEFLKLVEKLKD
jgi:hypothetical protein